MDKQSVGALTGALNKQRFTSADSFKTIPMHSCRHSVFLVYFKVSFRDPRVTSAATYSVLISQATFKGSLFYSLRHEQLFSSAHSSLTDSTAITIHGAVVEG